MASRELTWQARVALADHHKALGWTTIRLYDDRALDRPWEHVTAVSEQSGRLFFRADHPCGLRFEWLTEIRRREQDNGVYVGRVDLETLTEALMRLSPVMRVSAQNALCAELERAEQRLRGEEQEAARWRLDCAVLTGLVTGRSFFDPAPDSDVPEPSPASS